MLSKIVFRRDVQFLALALLILVLVASMGPANLSLLQARPVQAAALAAVPTSVFYCTPAAVGAFPSRVHVRCTSALTDGASTVFWFAVSTADSGSASRFLSIFTTAKVTGKVLALYYTSGDTSGTAWGCGAADCRAIWGAEVNP